MTLSSGERAILVATTTRSVSRSVVDEHLDELERLLWTAGGVAVDRAVQERRASDPATLVGRGFVERLGRQCVELSAKMLVFDEDLSASQVRNVEELVPDDVKILDRAAVILDIFAQHARTREAKTQVELAQLTYLLPRLTRRWRHLSRQAGGIGTRGVGETQLEIDRRLVSRRIARLRRELEDIERARDLRRARRRGVPTVALVGYTNAGKSSLFHRLTLADVTIEDGLFATLDPRSRRFDLGDGLMTVLTDTVGFIRKLPHQLVAPFRSTLESAAEADLLLHVIDASHPAWEAQRDVGCEVLDDLDVEPERTLTVANKIDRLSAAERGALNRRQELIPVSARSGEGMDDLRRRVARRLLESEDLQRLRIPLERSEAVRRALAPGWIVARRFHDTELTAVVRADTDALTRAGLDSYLVREA